MPETVDSSAEVLLVNPKNPLFHIERAGRTCYKSEDKITPGSAEKFVKMIFGLGHLSVVEHLAGVWRFKDVKSYEPDWTISSQMGMLLLSFLMETEQVQVTRQLSGHYFISMNMRSLVELAKKETKLIEYFLGGLKEESLDALFHGFKSQSSPDEVSFVGFAGDPEVWTKLHKLSFEYDDPSILKHIWVTSKFITDRGVTHEEVRHRPPSYSQESTRYCNYGNERFGGQITLHPDMRGLNDKQIERRLGLYEHIEQVYLAETTEGIKPQQARDNLPTCLKTEIVTTTHLAQWQWMFSQRLFNERAHPQIRKLFALLYKEFCRVLPQIFTPSSVVDEILC